MVKNSLDNPFFLFFLLMFMVGVNFLASIHLIVVMFAGVISIAFYRTLNQKYYYSLALVIISFLFIELNLGLKPFSLSLLSYFLYLFVIPRYEQSYINNFLYILFFYLGLAIMWYFFFNFTANSLYILVANILIDFLVFGIFLWKLG